MKKLVNKISIGLFLVFGLTAQAQVDSIKTGDIEIIKEYTPFVEEGKKQSFEPVMPRLQPNEKENLSYQNPSVFIETQYEPDEIKPLPYTDNNLKFIRTGYLQAGYGTANNPLVKFALNTMEKNNYTVGVNGGFQSVTGDLLDQKMNDINLGVFGTKELVNSTLHANIGYKRNENWLFGYDQSLIESEGLNDIDKVFNIINANIGLQSATTDEYALSHKTEISLNLLNENLADISETQVGLSTDLGIKIMQDLNAQLHASILNRSSENNSQSIVDFISQKETVLNLTPSVSPTINGIDAELGASINNDNEFGVKIFPHIKVEVPLSNNQYTFFAGWTGQTMMNGYQQLQAVNPRLSSQAFTRNYTKEVRTPAGIRGAVSDAFGFSLAVNQEVIQNATLWRNASQPNFEDFQVNSVFLPEYEEKLTNWRPELNATYKFGEKASIISNIGYNIYSTEVNAEAWQLPELDATFSFEVKPIAQLTLNGDFQALSGITYLEADGTNGELDGIFNANVGAGYDINKQFSIFIDANNLANSSVERWKNYPAVGTNILAGIVLSLD